MSGVVRFGSVIIIHHAAVRPGVTKPRDQYGRPPSVGRGFTQESSVVRVSFLNRPQVLPTPAALGELPTASSFWYSAAHSPNLLKRNA